MGKTKFEVGATVFRMARFGHGPVSMEEIVRETKTKWVTNKGNSISKSGAGEMWARAAGQSESYAMVSYRAWTEELEEEYLCDQLNNVLKRLDPKKMTAGQRKQIIEIAESQGMS